MLPDAWHQASPERLRLLAGLLMCHPRSPLKEPGTGAVGVISGPGGAPPPPLPDAFRMILGLSGLRLMKTLFERPALEALLGYHLVCQDAFLKELKNFLETLVHELKLLAAPSLNPQLPLIRLMCTADEPSAQLHTQLITQAPYENSDELWRVLAGELTPPQEAYAFMELISAAGLSCLPVPALLPPALNPNLFVYPYDAELSALLAPHLNEKPFKIRLGALQITHDLLTPVLAGEARKHAFEHAIKALLPDAQQDAARFYLEKITDLPSGTQACMHADIQPAVTKNSKSKSKYRT